MSSNKYISDMVNQLQDVKYESATDWLNSLERYDCPTCDGWSLWPGACHDCERQIEAVQRLEEIPQELKDVEKEIKELQDKKKSLEKEQDTYQSFLSTIPTKNRL